MLKKSFILAKKLHDGSGFQKYLTPAVLLGLVLLLGVVLRFYDLGTESYWVDEMYTIIEGQQSIPQMIASGRLDQPPGFYIPFHFWIKIFGTTEISTRAFSALTGIGAIILIYLIGRELFGNEVGLLGAFFMAISAFQIYYSQIIRFYIFFELMTLLSYLFFILALKSKRIIHFILYGITSVFMVYSLIFGAVILIAQNLFFFLQVKKYRNIMTIWLFCQALVLLAIVPYFYPLIFGQGGMEGTIVFNIGSISSPSLLDPLRSVVHFILLARGERSWGIMLVNYAMAGALLMAGTWVYANQQRKSNWVFAARGLASNLQEVPDVTCKILLVCCWLLCPILLPFIFSVMIHPIYREYYTISAAPAVYLLLALSIFNARKVVPLVISLGVLMIMIMPSLGYYYMMDMNEQWKEAAEYVEKNSQSDEVIIFAPNMEREIQQKTFNWYYQGTLPDCGLSDNLIEDPEILGALMQCITVHSRFWVIIPDPAIRMQSFFLNSNQTDMHLIKKAHLVGLSVYFFELSK